MNKNELVLYSQLLSDIKERVRNAQHRVILSANAEMTLMYWDIGRMIASRMDREGWGAKVIPRLAVDLRNELPEQKGFSERNIRRMLRFNREYPELQEAVTQKVPQAVAQIAVGPVGELPIVPQPVAQLPSPAGGSEAFALIPWGHNMVLMEKVKEPSDRLWYARQTLEHGWSRDTLTANIKSSAHTRQGAAVSNFGKRLPAVHAELASGLLKDPYMFDFFTMEEHFHERELETGLLTHIEKFLLELGRGFAFVGRQYSLRDIEKPIGVADYELTRALPENLASSLPSIEAIEAELSQDLSEDES